MALGFRQWDNYWSTPQYNIYGLEEHQHAEHAAGWFTGVHMIAPDFRHPSMYDFPRGCLAAAERVADLSVRLRKLPDIVLATIDSEEASRRVLQFRLDKYDHWHKDLGRLGKRHGLTQTSLAGIWWPAAQFRNVRRYHQRRQLVG